MSYPNQPPPGWQPPPPGYAPQQYPPAPYPGAGYPPPAQQSFPRREVTKSRKRTSHGLHLVLTICTGGAWGLLVWLPITLWHKMGPRAKSVTRYK